MFGISWGGFNGLQVAARRPPELQAVISMCASDDRYADDVHYIGGCVLALDMLPWAATMLTLLAQPPDPADGRRRLARHVVRADGTHAGVRRAVARAPAPRRLLAPRLGLRGLRARSRPRSTRSAAGPTATRTRSRACSPACPGRARASIGPWSHAFPQDGEPGPAIGFLQECLRWWDHWLKGADTGIMDEPMLRAWMQDPVRAGRLTTPSARAAGSPRSAGRRPRSTWPSGPWPRTASARRAPLRERRAGRGGAPAPQPADRRAGRGRVVRRRRRGRLPGRPARRGRPLAHVHLAAARGARRDPRLPGGDARGRRRPPAGRSSPSACATSRPTAPRCSSPAAC